MTAMPVLRDLLTGGMGNDSARATSIGQILHSAVNFDIQVADDIASDRCKVEQKIDESMGPVAPPFPSTWAEWKRHGEFFGCLVIEMDPRAPKGQGITLLSGCRADYALEQFVIADDGQTRIAPGAIAIRVHDDKRCAEIGYAQPDDEDEPTGDTKDLLVFNAYTVLTALALINCKNVSTQETGKVGIRRSGAEKRRGATPLEIRYNTIILPGGGSESDGKGGHRATALHRVRGHFKTFTTDKPLLGKHTGTYWWGWQVRGNAEKGTVVSDYKVSA